MSNVAKLWNFNDSKQAREYLASCECRKDGKMLKIEMVTTESGRDLWFKDMTDEEACFYASELAKILGAKPVMMTTPQPAPPDTQEKDEARRAASDLWVSLRYVGVDIDQVSIEPALKILQKHLSSYAAARRAKLEARIYELEGALSKLLKLREHKRAFGKDESYVNLQPLVWSNAEKVLTKGGTKP